MVRKSAKASAKKGKEKTQASESTQLKETTITETNPAPTLSSNSLPTTTKNPSPTPSPSCKSPSPSPPKNAPLPKTPEADDSIIKEPASSQGDQPKSAEEFFNTVGEREEEEVRSEEADLQIIGQKKGTSKPLVHSRVTRSSLKNIGEVVVEEQSMDSAGTKRKRTARKSTRGMSVESPSVSMTDLGSRVVLSGCKTEVGYFDESALSDVKELLEFQGWMALFDVCDANIDGVRKFYINLKQMVDRSLGSAVNDVEVNVSVASLAGLLNIPRDGFDEYSGDGWPTLIGVSPDEVHDFVFGGKVPKKAGTFKTGSLKEPVMLVLHSLCNKMIIPRAQENNVSLSRSTTPVIVLTKGILKQKGLIISAGVLKFREEEPVETPKPAKKKQKAEEPAGQKVILKRLESQEEKMSAVGDQLSKLVTLVESLSTSFIMRMSKLEKQVAGSSGIEKEQVEEDQQTDQQEDDNEEEENQGEAGVAEEALKKKKQSTAELDGCIAKLEGSIEAISDDFKEMKELTSTMGQDIEGMRTLAKDLVRGIDGIDSRIQVLEVGAEAAASGAQEAAHELVTHVVDTIRGELAKVQEVFQGQLHAMKEQVESTRRRGVKTLAEGIAVAESLVEVSSGSRRDKGKVDEESDHEGEEASLQSRAKHIAYGKDKAQSKGDSRNEEGKQRNEGRQRQVHAGAWESVKCLISLGKWKGKVDFLVVDMEDEDVVLGWEFLNSVTPVTMGQEVMTITHNGCKHELKLARNEEDGARNTSLKAWWVLGDKH
uniref:Uncharacterized protein n=1 Tax=Chenopodium quinoa TaxID=63459 RepID=A0A803N9L8_CHEQI